MVMIADWLVLLAAGVAGIGLGIGAVVGAAIARGLKDDRR